MKKLKKDVSIVEVFPLVFNSNYHNGLTPFDAPINMWNFKRNLNNVLTMSHCNVYTDKHATVIKQLRVYFILVYSVSVYMR